MRASRSPWSAAFTSWRASIAGDISRTYISEIEKGERNVSIDNMGALADALGVPLKSLVDPEYFKDLTAKQK